MWSVAVCGVCVHVCTRTCTHSAHHIWDATQRPEGGTKSSGAEATSECESRRKLGAKLRLPGRAVCIVNRRAISPARRLFLNTYKGSLTTRYILPRVCWKWFPDWIFAFFFLFFCLSYKASTDQHYQGDPAFVSNKMALWAPEYRTLSPALYVLPNYPLSCSYSWLAHD